MSEKLADMAERLRARAAPCQPGADQELFDEAADLLSSLDEGLETERLAAEIARQLGTMGLTGGLARNLHGDLAQAIRSSLLGGE